jgi:hypothetical protein
MKFLEEPNRATEVPNASETVKGIAEIATQAEALAGIDDSRIVTPAKVKVIGNRYARTAFVGKNGDNATAQLGNPLYPFRDIQPAITALQTGNTPEDVLDIYGGVFTENLNWTALSNITFRLKDAVIIGNHTPNYTTNFTVENSDDSEWRSTAISPNLSIINHSNGTFKFSGGQVTVNHLGAGVSLNNVGSLSSIKQTRFLTTVASSALSLNLCPFVVYDAKFRGTSTYAPLDLGQTDTSFYNITAVNSSSGLGVNCGTSNSSTFYNPYIRSQGGNAIGSPISWQVNLVGGQVISNSAYALNADSNGASIVTAKGTHFYGVNAVFRGQNSPFRRSILKFYDCLLQATSGEILVNNPMAPLTTCLLSNTRISKALTAGQNADATVIQDILLDSTMVAPNLTLLC